jgi:hypothetical protein
MKELLKRLNYREYKRIALINADDSFFNAVAKELKEVIIDREIDQRCPYEFMIFFVRSVTEVEQLAQIAIHNLTADGVLWFCYPKKTSKKYSSGLDRDHGWNSLNDAGLHGIRMAAIDDDWSALRFRNIKFIKSASGRFEKL